MAINSGLGFMFIVCLYITLLRCSYLVHPVEATSPTITHPQEVKALKAIKEKMRNRKWEFSEDPCSGKGSWNVIQDLETQNRVVCKMYKTEGKTFLYVTRIYLKSQNLTGVVPAELANLTYLEEIDFSFNHLNGQIPPELGSLTYLKKLSLGMNHLSGRVPKELGNLTNLQKLDLFSNELYGRLPQSLVDLIHLKILCIQSNQLNGKIPKIYRNFHGLEHFRASSNNFSGKIPYFIGNWRNLTILEIEATSLEGPIPSTFSNLIRLKDLVLRNALIYGEIPKYIGDSVKPKILDLRFNNLIGSIPRTLENKADKHPKIEYLYLGNNNLTGKLEEWLSIMYTSLAINCGGNPGSIYEGDTNPLGPSSYFSSTSRNWAVSNTGHFMDAQHHQWIVRGDTSQFAKGTNTELYGTARCASTSLRYYALCLQNGQYNVQLHFAEIIIPAEMEKPKGTTFANLGRRVFDVYIQGTRRLKDFNIMDAAGGSYKVVIKNLTVNVTENYLEIHFFWAGKGTYDIPVKGTYGPLVSAIKISPNFKINSTRNSRNKSNKIMTIVMLSGAVIALGFTVCMSFIFIRKRNRMKSRSFAANDDAELTEMDTISNTCSLEVIKNATNDFSPDNKIGEGGFGAVFKGIHPDGKMIAVKQMFPKARQGIRDFLNELGTISAVQHPNLVELYGFCVDGKQLLLVYEYMENNSLARCLFGPQESRLNLDWPQRYNICLGVARGLAYLHEGSRIRIIHRDIKSMNILLDQDLNPKISDFGLAKLFDQEKTHVTTRLAGTMGYMAPEYAIKGHLTEKADVYAFGVVILEVVSGRKCIEKKLRGERFFLLEWTWNLYEKKMLLDLVDVSLKNSSYSKKQILRVINVGLLCTHESPLQRPSMSTVVGMLEGKIEAHVSHSRPSFLE